MIWTQNKNLLNVDNEIEFLEAVYIHFKYNITLEERHSTGELQNNKQIIMNPSYKERDWIVMNSSYYEHEIVMKEHLNTNTYERVADNADKEVFRKLRKLIEKFENHLTEKFFLQAWKGNLPSFIGKWRHKNQRKFR